jgi:hypothetical protein
MDLEARNCAKRAQEDLLARDSLRIVAAILHHRGEVMDRTDLRIREQELAELADVQPAVWGASSR